MTNGATEIVDLRADEIARRVLHQFGDNSFAVKTTNIGEIIYSVIKGDGNNLSANIAGSNNIGTTEAIVGRATQYLPTTASRLYAVSDSNDDDLNGGSAAQRIEIYGLDSDGNSLVDYCDLSGANNSELTFNSFWRVNRVAVCSVGSYGGSNNGNISVKTEAGTTCAVIPRVGSTKYGSSEDGIYTVPKGYSALIVGGYGFVDGTKTATINFYIRQKADDTTAPYSGARQLVLSVPSIQGEIEIRFDAPIFLPELPI